MLWILDTADLRIRILLFSPVAFKNKMPTKIIFFAITLFEGTLTSVSKKKSERSHKTVEIKVFLTFFLLDFGRIHIRTNYYRSGSERPKNLRIHNALNTRMRSMRAPYPSSCRYLQLVLEAERVERVELRFLHSRNATLTFKPLFKKMLND